MSPVVPDLPSFSSPGLSQVPFRCVRHAIAALGHRSPVGSVLCPPSWSRELQPWGRTWHQNHSGSWDHSATSTSTCGQQRCLKSKNQSRAMNAVVSPSWKLATSVFIPSWEANLQHLIFNISFTSPDTGSGDRQCSACSRAPAKGASLEAKQ